MKSIRDSARAKSPSSVSRAPKVLSKVAAAGSCFAMASISASPEAMALSVRMDFLDRALEGRDPDLGMERRGRRLEVGDGP